MRNSKSQNTKWSIFICAIILVIIGLFALYSASYSSGLEKLTKQIIWILISLVAFFIVIKMDYRSLARISIGFYVISIVLLLIVLLTSAINGATSWFNIGNISIQPAEFAKIAVVLFLASKMSKVNRNETSRPANLLKFIGIVLLPVILIALQPDYGTALSYVFGAVIMIYLAGLKKRYIFLDP